MHVFPYDDQEEVFDPSGAVLECIEDYRRRNPDKQSTVADTKLEYLQGCEALHGPSNEKCAVELQRNARECVAGLAKRAQDPAKAATPGDAKLNHPHGIKDIQLKVPEKVTHEVMYKAFNEIERPYCYSRANVRPENNCFIEAAPVGLIKQNFMGVCTR